MSRISHTALEPSYSKKPLAIDLYAGLGGWTEGLLAEGYRVVGFDNERHIYGEARYPGQLVIQDVLTLHGSQFKDAALIVASPPCQAYSYRAMPWKRAKALPPPNNSLFEACFRIQREAEHAAGHPIPLVVENVCGAQKWVGRARWHYGSFYLWGDVPALMPIVRKHIKVPTMGAGWYPPDHPKHVRGLAFNGHADRNLRSTKNDGGSWFAVAHNTTSGHGRNPDGRLRGLHGEDALRASVLRSDGVLVSGLPGSGAGIPGIKIPSESQRRTNVGNGARFTSRENAGVKVSGDWFGSYAEQKAAGTISPGRLHGKGSKNRAAASAHIAKIPYDLSRWIAKCYYPNVEFSNEENHSEGGREVRKARDRA